MSDFVVVAKPDHLPPGEGTVVTVAPKNAALFNVDGAGYAMDDSCLPGL